MRKIILALPVIALSACADGPAMDQSVTDANTLQSGMSRIVVYRTELFGGAIQPKIYVDGEAIARCVPKGAFVVDVPKGEHTVSAVTEVEDMVIADTTRDPITYVRCSVDPGLITARPDLQTVDPTVGKQESAGLSEVPRL